MSKRIDARQGHKAILVSFMAFVSIVASSVPARAELAFFANGRTLPIKSHRIDGESLVLTLRSGGEIVCDTNAIARFAPDEVPYPEDEARLKADPTPEGERGVRLQPDLRYAEIIDKMSAQHGVDAKLVRALIQVESAYRQTARSRKGAMGLMQLMPDTARQYGVKDPYDPESNIEGGIKYLKTLLERLPLDYALAAYNAGEAAVERFHGVPPYSETRNYVSRIVQILGR